MQGVMLEAGRLEVQNHRVPVLPADSHHQRRRQWVHPVHVSEGDQHRVDRHDAELGSAMAEQLGAPHPGALIQGHLHRRPDAVHLRRRAGVVVAGHDIRHQRAV